MTEQLPLVSIVTPSFNQGRWLEESIRSVLDQDYPNIEYLVMDGGSTDGSLDVLRRYEGRVRYNSGPDGGQSQALCTAYARMKGEILGWINADDAYTPGAVRRAVQALTAEPKLGMVYGNAEFIDGAGRSLGVSRHVARLTTTASAAAAGRLRGTAGGVLPAQRLPGGGRAGSSPSLHHGLRAVAEDLLGSSPVATCRRTWPASGSCLAPRPPAAVGSAWRNWRRWCAGTAPVGCRPGSP